MRCNSPLDESNKILRKNDSIHRVTFEGILGFLMSDTSWDQVCVAIHETRVGIKRSTDQVQDAHFGSVSHASVLAE